MKVIFLDFDGVINNDVWFENLTPERRADGDFTMLDPSLINRIRLLVEKSGANIVVSSAWRTWHETPEALISLFNEAGWDGAPIIDITPVMASNIKRGFEVNAWLSKHPEVTSYVILDDNNWFLPGQNLVLTDYRRGITDEDVKEALDFLV